MTTFADTICRGGQMGVWLAEQMLKDVKPEVFACKPVGAGGAIIHTNHPAFIFGHLAGYPAKWLEMVGLPSAAAAAPPGFADLFNAGKECRHDPERTFYPPMNEITAAFFQTHRAAFDALAGVGDDVLARPNPKEGRFPTLAGVLMFYVNNHVMLHVGQLSAWRRCMGLGAAM